MDGNWDAVKCCNFASRVSFCQKYFRFILPQEDAASWKDRWQLVYIEDLSTGADAFWDYFKSIC